MPRPIVTLGEGGTPLLPAPALSRRTGADVWVKFEGMNPTGSFKDRGMTMAVTKAVERGAKVVICASTGNTSASAAAYATHAGITAAVLVPEGKIAMGKLSQAIAHNAQLIQVQGNFDDCLDIARDLAANYPVHLVNSVNNDRIEGQKTAAFEVVEVLGDAPDLHFIPVGNAGNYTAYTRGYREDIAAGNATRMPRMFGFQASGSAPIVRGEPVRDPDTIASAIRIGNPASWELALQARDESDGYFGAIDDDKILEAQRILSAEVGIFVEPASAISVAGLLERSAAGVVPAGARVVLTVTGHGLKDPQWALRTADGSDVQPTVVPVDTAHGRPGARARVMTGATVAPDSGVAASVVGRTVHVKVPATSANLGPGFDTLGLALARYDELDVEATDAAAHDIQVHGVGAGEVPLDESHLVVRAIAHTFARAGVPLPSLRLVAHNAIPHGRGLGSSGAAIVAGVMAAKGLLEGVAEFTPDELLELATELEGHPDNVAPALFGGLTIAWVTPDGPRHKKLIVHRGVSPLVLVPEHEMSTALARSLQPESVPHEDAVFNVSRSALLIAALIQSPELLLAATEDKLHQHYRAQAMPETDRLIRALRAAGHPAVVSGAGPSILVLASDPSERAEAIALVEASADTAWQALPLAVDFKGATVQAA